MPGKGERKMRKLNIMSPTREKNYTVLEAIKKILQRRSFKVLSLELKTFPSTNSYSDIDGNIYLEIETMPSQWTCSIDCRIKAVIPFHRSIPGDYSFGSHYHDTPEEEDMTTFIHAWLDIETRQEDEIQFTWDSGTEDPDQREIQIFLAKMVKEAIIKTIMDEMCEI